MGEWFKDCRTLDEARLEYRRLCFAYHPDHGGDNTTMQLINIAYERFKLERSTSRYTGPPRTTWQRPPRKRPTDVPPQHSRPTAPNANPRPSHSRDYIRRVWTSEPWQTLENGNQRRSLWGQTVLLLQHPAAKFEGAWFVMLNDTFSPYFYPTRAEAETAAFDLLYEQVKYFNL